MKFVSYNLIEKTSIEEYFKTQLNNFLIFNLGIPTEPTQSIVNAVFNLYNAENRFYHTHKHIIYIFKNVEVNDVYLCDVGKAIIFFHDVIYNPGKNHNEENSAMIFSTLLREFVSEDFIFKVSTGIKETAKFLQDETNQKYHKILDLDLMGLASPWDDFVASSKDIENEFRTVFSLEEYLNGRLNFIDIMLKKESIYKTEFFSCLEERARYNLGKEQKICFERLK